MSQWVEIVLDDEWGRSRRENSTLRGNMSLGTAYGIAGEGVWARKRVDRTREGLSQVGDERSHTACKWDRGRTVVQLL